MSLVVVGDIHGKFPQYAEICQWADENKHHTLQIGDFGIGFRRDWDHSVFEWQKKNPNHRFFRGNHDDPAVCAKSPNYMGDFGFDSYNSVFWLAGADSIDKAYRQKRDKEIGIVTWWADEQLNAEQRDEAFELYQKAKPRIMLSHDCPQFLLKSLFNYGNAYPTPTGTLLQDMFDFHQPELWIFGHHHKNISVKVRGTLFSCVDELGMYYLPDVDDVKSR